MVALPVRAAGPNGEGRSVADRGPWVGRRPRSSRGRDDPPSGAGRTGRRAKGASKSCSRVTGRSGGVVGGEYRRTGARVVARGATGTEDPDQAAPLGP